MPKLSMDHVRVCNRAGTVQVVFCQHCQEELPITKPLGLDTLAAVMKAFSKCHARCWPKETQRSFLEKLDGK